LSEWLKATKERERMKQVKRMVSIEKEDMARMTSVDVAAVVAYLRLYSRWLSVLVLRSIVKLKTMRGHVEMLLLALMALLLQLLLSHLLELLLQLEQVLLQSERLWVREWVSDERAMTIWIREQNTKKALLSPQNQDCTISRT
jgi:hypothetical protein